MLRKLTREAPLGALLLIMAGTMALDAKPATTSTYLFIHIAFTALMVPFLSRSARAGNIATVSLVSVILLFSLFGAYILGACDRVAAEGPYDFSAFSSDSVRRALVLNDFALGMALIIFALHPQLAAPSQHLFSEALRMKIVQARPGRMFSPLTFCSCWALILGVLAFTPNVMQFPYPQNFAAPRAIPIMMRTLIVLIPLTLSLLDFMRHGNRISPAGAAWRATTYAAIFLVGLLAGARGAMVGLLIGLIIVDANYCRDQLVVKAASVLLSFFYAVFAVMNWQYMRVRICDIGFFTALAESFSTYQLTGSHDAPLSVVYLTDYSMLSQSLFHFLYAIALVDSGESLRYQTFLNLIPQQLPGFLDGLLWTRPTNDNILLMDKFYHGGGFYSFANAYWNGGIPALTLFSLALSWAIARIELFFKKADAQYAPAYFIFVLILPVTFYYGIQGLVRGMEYGFAAYFGIYLAKRLLFRRSPARAAVPQ